MASFSDYELRVLRWVSRHEVLSSTASRKIPQKHQKTVLFLMSNHSIFDNGVYYELSQVSKDALAHQKELSRVQKWRDFFLGFLAGVLSSLFVAALGQILTAALQ